ncbi:MAG: YbaB/EbfC family nucleoid-associated protein [bacterium]|nr:YbaB/EbfC family nucleoid-associated protein [bacterium]
MFDKAKQMYDLQKKAKAMQKELKATEIEAKSTDGRVTIIFNGEQRLQDIQIDESLMGKDNKIELEKLLERTINEAISRAQVVAAEKTKAIMKDMNLNIPGM